MEEYFFRIANSHLYISNYIMEQRICQTSISAQYRYTHQKNIGILRTQKRGKQGTFSKPTRRKETRAAGQGQYVVGGWQGGRLRDCDAWLPE